jgi:hypothetical protein
VHGVAANPRGSLHKPGKRKRGERGLSEVERYAGKAHSPAAELNQDLIQRETATTAAIFVVLRKYLRQKEEGEYKEGE